MSTEYERAMQAMQGARQPSMQPAAPAAGGVMDPELAAFLGVSGKPAGITRPEVARPTASPAPAAGMDPELAAFLGVPGAPQAPQKPSAAPGAPPPAAGRGITRRAPPKPPASVPEPTWGETLIGAGKALPSSSLNAIRQLGEAITSPGETFEGLKQLALGMASKGAGAIGVSQDPAAKAKTESVLNSMIDDYKRRYGSEAEFKRALMTDPASILMDITSVAVPGAGAAARAAGAGSKAGAVAGAISKGTQFADPLSLTVKGASLIPSSLGHGVRWTLGKTTGLPKEFLDIASTIADKAPTQGKDAFFRALRGNVTPAELATRLDNGFNTMRREASSAFMAKFPQFANNRVDLGDVASDVSQKLAALTTSPTRHIGNERISQLARVRKMLNEVVSNPRNQGLEQVHDLKRALDDMIDANPSATLKGDLVDIRRQVRDALSNPSKGGNAKYTDLMEQYQTAIQEIKDLQYHLGGASAGSARIASAINRIKKSSYADNALARLGQIDPEAPAMLAGSAMRAWDATGSQTLLGALGSVGAAAFIHPAALAGLIPTSPRVVGRGLAASSYGTKLARGATGFGAQRAAYFGSLAGGVGEGMPAPVSEQEQRIAQEINADPFFSAMLQRESNAEHFEVDPKTGEQRPKVSSAGAIGIAQVMPKTGPEAARLAGEDWSLDRLKNDPAYNARLGYAYYQDQLRRFDGDPYVAAAAYNAGPGRVQEAFRKARDGTGNYLDYLPRETQNYVAYVAERTQRPARASGGKVTSKQAVLVDRLMDRVKKAHNQITQDTKPLLNLPDEAVADALAAANRAI
jgi:hypothetical protein